MCIHNATIATQRLYSIKQLINLQNPSTNHSIDGSLDRSVSKSVSVE